MSIADNLREKGNTFFTEGLIFKNKIKNKLMKKSNLKVNLMKLPINMNKLYQYFYILKTKIQIGKIKALLILSWFMLMIWVMISKSNN